MNRPERPAQFSAADMRFVLATDLDGTFLGGSDADREKLYDWIEGNRDSVGLVFVTGRDPEFIGELCDDTRVPWPDYVVGDVGTTIARVSDQKRIEPVDALEKDISERWGDMGPRVREALDNWPGLSLQPTDFRFRVSYDYDPARFDPEAKQIVDRMGLDHLISDNRFFDVLPRGVSKGPSLSRLISHLGIEPARVLVAGDTMNDLSMLAMGLPAVAVGGSEEALVAELKGASHVHHSSHHGAGGIWDAIRVFDLHDLP